MYNVVIIGAGQLGSRHLQSIKSTTHECNVCVVDSSDVSLERCKVIYDGADLATNVKEIFFCKDITSLPSEIDFLLIATGSKPRFVLFDAVAKQSTVKNVVFEKVLFQKEEEYFKTEEILKAKGVNAWVNCPRRMYEVYNKIKPYIFGKTANMVVSGGNWGMGCNSVHFIDAYAFITGCSEYTMVADALNSKLVESKRLGYKEFHGTLTANFANGGQLVISSADNYVNDIIAISTDDTICYINEGGRECMIKSKDISKVFPFTIPYQSQLSSIVLDSILDSGTCQLPSFEESMRLHLPFIKSILGFLNNNGMNTDNCPIT